MMHSKKPNVVVAICSQDTKKTLREFNVESLFKARKASIVLPFDSEYFFLIKNLEQYRIRLELEIDGMDVGSVVIDANCTVNLERYIYTDSKFKFVRKDHQDVTDPTSDKNSSIKVTVYGELQVIEDLNYSPGDFVPMSFDMGDNYCEVSGSGAKDALCNYSCSDIPTRRSKSILESGATVEGSKSNQNFKEVTWEGDAEDVVYTFEFDLKGIADTQLSLEEKEEYALYEKLKSKYATINPKEVKKDDAHIVSIIDSSGSMMSIKNDTIGGYNSFIDEQKKILVGRNVRTSLYFFNHELEKKYFNIDINDVGQLSERNYITSGSTALYDSVVAVIDEVAQEMAKFENKNKKVIINILTDGEENASCRFRNSDLKERISFYREKYNWEFVFLGANQDSFGVAGSMGISAEYTANFKATGDGVRSAYGSISKSVTSYLSSDN